MEEDEELDEFIEDIFCIMFLGVFKDFECIDESNYYF